MFAKVKARKSELLLLLMTAVFLGVLGWMAHTDRQSAAERILIETAVPQEDFLPDVSPVNINTATPEELESLPGIGSKLAQRIVDYRTENGPFQTPEELMEVNGVGEGKFAEIAERITTDGVT